MSKRIYLQCLVDQTRKIFIPDNEIIILGRNHLTALQDPHLSRKHLECKSSSNHLIVKTIGKCYSGCNGYALMLNETYHLKNNDIIELRLGYHKFKVVLESVEEDNGEPSEKKTKYPVTKYPIFNTNKPIKKASSVNITGKWESIEDNEVLVFTSENCIPQSIIASFDMDGTLIKTKSGAVFPKHKDDWEVIFNVVPKMLKELYENDYKIVIFTNQSGVGKNSDKIKEFKQKIESIIQTLSVPMQVYVSLGKGMYRKPITGMWSMLCNLKNGGKRVDLEKSFYVGDAAGREKDWMPKRKKDHSNADRLFALNIGLKFYTPEEYFLKTSQNQFKMPLFDPRQLKVTHYTNYSSDKQDIILMVGSQGSGKSHFCRTKLLPAGYIHINRDKLKSWEKCVLMLEECINKKKNAVIDNTNPDKVSRKKYIAVAKKHNIQCRCFVMSTSFEHCKHNNKFRALTDKTHEPIGDMLLYSYRKNFEPPEMLEGFSEIVDIPFIPKFDSQEHNDLYKMFLLES